MKDYYHSVVLDKSKCKGCTTCLRNCPTQAIRVRNGKATIIKERCIDCGECIRVCPYHAKNAVTDSLNILKDYKYTVAMPAPTTIAQFKRNISVNKILTAFKKIGFDEVCEVAYGAEIVGEALKFELEGKTVRKPLISSACPAVVRLIQVRFPELIPNLVSLESPMEITARIARKRIMKEKNLEAKDIGIIFITPCAAKATTIHNYIPWDNAESSVDASISIKEIYPELLDKLDSIEEENLQHSSGRGLIWAHTGGESSFIPQKQIINVDGIHNVIGVLEEIENGRLSDLDFFEGLACIGGCVGGCLTVENTFIAKKKIMDRSAEKKNMENDITDEMIKDYYDSGFLNRHGEVYRMPVTPLDPDIKKAMEKMEMMDRIQGTLPGIDCGSCGAPDCRALAEDIVRGQASEVDCIFVLREAINELSKLMYDLSEKVVPVMKEKNEGDDIE
ncbi:MAG: 4Fe-4S binding protein [Eubacteriaceae bacterium]|nr:4Fe-4S binding protein [Eubacteriaceae bacterium]